MRYWFYFLFFIFYIFFISSIIFFFAINIKKIIFKGLGFIIIIYSIIRIFKNKKNEKKDDNIYLEDLYYILKKSFLKRKSNVLITILGFFIFLKLKIFIIIILQLFITIIMTVVMFSDINSKKETEDNFEITLNLEKYFKNRDFKSILKFYFWEIPKIRAFLINYIILMEKEEKSIKKKETYKILKRVLYYKILDIPYFLVLWIVEILNIVEETLDQCNLKEKYRTVWLYIFLYELKKIIIKKYAKKYYIIIIKIKFMKIKKNKINNELINKILNEAIYNSYCITKGNWGYRKIYTPKPHCGMFMKNPEKGLNLGISYTHSIMLNNIEGFSERKLLDGSTQFCYKILLDRDYISRKNCSENFNKNNGIMNNEEINELADSIQKILILTLDEEKYILHDIRNNYKKLYNLEEIEVKNIETCYKTKVFLNEIKPQLKEKILEILKKNGIEDEKEIEITMNILKEYIDKANREEILNHTIKGSEMYGLIEDIKFWERIKNKSEI